MALAGMGFSAFGAGMLGGGRPFGGLNPLGIRHALAETPADMAAWLKDVSKPYSGPKIRHSTEATPPSIVPNQPAREEFTKLTGIQVESAIVPLGQRLQK